jgi:hypothetical protein
MTTETEGSSCESEQDQMMTNETKEVLHGRS